MNIRPKVKTYFWPGIFGVSRQAKPALKPMNPNEKPLPGLTGFR
jgi:hypothetical protein